MCICVQQLQHSLPANGMPAWTIATVYDYIALTNVNDVAMFVNHDVTIVPILDLQQVADKRVGSHTPDEVAASLRKESVWYA